jgi:hypothetical protein
MLHSIGCCQPDAKVLVNVYNNSSASAAVHAFIDGNNDGLVYQTLPWNYRGWHAGGSANNTHIGVEMCEGYVTYSSGAKLKASDAAKAKACAERNYKTAVELFAMLCKKYNLNPTADGVIISHNEGHHRGVASGHVDPEHWWTGIGIGYTMDKFRKDVKAAMSGASVPSNPAPAPSTPSAPSTPTPIKPSDPNVIYRVRLSWEDSKSQIGAWKNLDSAKAQVDSNPAYKAFDNNGKVVYEVKAAPAEYKVKVTASALNVRAGAGTSYKVVNVINKNEVYTVVDEQNGFGLLKAYASGRNGWISLDYVKKV